MIGKHMYIFSEDSIYNEIKYKMNAEPRGKYIKAVSLVYAATF